MNAGLLGLFSGFPAHHFPDAIAQTLRENLPRRESLLSQTRPLLPHLEENGQLVSLRS